MKYFNSQLYGPKLIFDGIYIGTQKLVQTICSNDKGYKKFIGHV